MVDPARRVALKERVDDAVGIHVEVKSVMGLGRVMRVPLQGLFPIDALSAVFHDALPGGYRTQCKNPFAMNARYPHFGTPRGLWRARTRCC